MKNFILVLILNLISLSFLSQTTSTTYTCFDGTTFKAGDSIVFGPKSIQSRYMYVKYNAGDKGFPKVSDNVVGKKVPILKFKKYSDNGVFKDDVTFAICKGKGLLATKFYIDMDNAVRSGEIISQGPTMNMAKLKAIGASELTTFGLYAKKLNQIDFLKEEFLFRFNRDIYDNSYQDEFEYNSAIQSAKNKLSEVIKLLDDTKTYHVSCALNLLEYDFEKGGFPIDLTDLDVLVVKSIFKGLTNAKYNYPDIHVHMDNSKEFAFLKIPAEDAKRFISRRKSNNGRVDREVHVLVQFTINDIEPAKNTGTRSLSCSIKEINVLEFRHPLGNYLGTIK